MNISSTYIAERPLLFGVMCERMELRRSVIVTDKSVLNFEGEEIEEWWRM